MKLSLYKNHFLVMQTNYFLQKNKINKIRLPSLQYIFIQSEYFQEHFCKLEQDGLFFLQYTSVHAKRIWQAVHHQDSSYDSRSQEVSIELVGLLHVKKNGIP